MNDIVIREVDMPYCINGYTKLDADGIYNMYININHSKEQKKKTIKHEFNHIKNGDILKRDADINTIEANKITIKNYNDVVFLSRF